MKLKNYRKIFLVATLLWTFFLTPFGEASRIKALQRLVKSIKTKSTTGQQRALKELGIQGSSAAQRQQLFLELLDKDPSLRNEVTEVISQKKGKALLSFIDSSNKGLRGFNFKGADLAGADFAGINFAETNFEGANLEGAILEDANLTEANLAGADLERAILMSFLGNPCWGKP